MAWLYFRYSNNIAMNLCDFLHCSSGTVAMEFKRKIQVLWNTDYYENLSGKILSSGYFQNIIGVCKFI